jgi:hypothetical protein
MPIAASVNGHAQAVMAMFDTGSAHPALDLPASRAGDNGIDPGRSLDAAEKAA